MRWCPGETRRFGVLGLMGVAMLSLAQAQPADPTPPPAEAAETMVNVSGFTITGNSLLDSVALAGVLGRFKGERSFADLREAAQAVQAMYAEAGYGAVVAYLPPQALDGGNVTIAVVEGKIGSVVVNGADRLGAERVRRALPTLQEGQTPRVRRIDSELQMANENPSRRMGVLLGPGAQPGEVQATVNVVEEPLHRFNIGLDNTGNDRTGDYRLSGGWQYADLSGHDDVLSVQLQTSPTESNAVTVVSAGYRLPLPQWLAALDVFAAYSDVDGGATSSPAGDVSFAGKGRVVGFRGSAYLPRLGEFDQRASLGLDYRAYLNNCAVAGLPPGACGSAGESVVVYPLSLDYSVQKGGDLQLAFNVGLAHNLNFGGSHTSRADFEAIRTGAERRYTLLRAGASAAVPLFEEWSVSARVALQYSGDSLVPGEQFGIGGADSMRGYEEREVSGDRGVAVSTELVTPRLRWAGTSALADLRLLAFADAGQVTNRDDAPCAGTRTRCSLASVGFGARLMAGKVSAALLVGRALKDGLDTQRHDWRSHFAIDARF